jgi:HK97 family phage prohead protease
MMRTTTQDTELIFEIREDADGDIVGIGTGRAVPYNVEIEIGGVRESFARDAFNVEDVIGKPLAYRHNEPVGIITGAENREDGLYIDFQIVNTALGRDAAVLARTGSSRGLSVGFNPIKSAWTKTRDAVQHMRAGLQEVSLTPYPAYATAGVSAIREDEGVPMSETIVETEVVSVDTEAREAIAQVRETVASIEARAFTAEPVHPLAQFRSFGEYSKAVLAGEVESRALADQVTANNPGVLPPMWMQDVKGIIDLGRRVIQGVGGPQSAGTSGMDINWPFFDGVLTDIVEAQASEKGEVNSVEIDIEKGTATLATYAAGSDISYQLLQRSSPSYLDAHNRIMVASYAAVTDRKFTSDLWNDGTGVEDYVFSSDTTGAAFREAVFNSSVTVEDATGTPASAVFVSTAVFKKIGGWSTFIPAPYSPNNVSGIATASTLQVQVSGLPVIRAKWLDTNAAYNAIVTNGAAARWIEDGPRLAQAENVAKLGRDYAIHGYGVSGVYLPAGVVRVYNAP